MRGYASASEFLDSNPCADPGCILLDLRMPGASALDRSATQHRGVQAGPPGTNAAGPNPFGSHFDEVLQARRDEAEEFYKAITPASLNADWANVMRQALAGMLRSKHMRKPDGRPTLRILVKERKVGNDPALSKVNRHCDRVAVRTLTDALSGWDPTIEWYGNILVVRRVLDEVGLSATGAIPPNDRPGSVQIQVIVQHLASVQHSPRIE